MFDFIKLFRVATDAVNWANLQFSDSSGLQRKQAAIQFAQDTYDFTDNLINNGTFLNDDTDKWAKEVILPNIIELAYRYLGANPDAHSEPVLLDSKTVTDTFDSFESQGVLENDMDQSV
jgi:hypothetical protein